MSNEASRAFAESISGELNWGEEDAEGQESSSSSGSDTSSEDEEEPEPVLTITERITQAMFEAYDLN